MDLGRAIHKAIDFFFCDRCPIEAVDTVFSDRLSHICPFAYIWDMKILPPEEFDNSHPIYFPRSRILKLTGTNRGLQALGPVEYAE